MNLKRLAAAAFIAFAAPAVAQSSPALSQARQAGAIGERFDGYMGVVAGTSEEVRRQVGAVNIRRRTLYIGLASRRRVTVDAVGIATGCELLRGVKVGEAYMLADGTWRRRAPGEAPPVPEYCAS